MSQAQGCIFFRQPQHLAGAEFMVFGHWAKFLSPNIKYCVSIYFLINPGAKFGSPRAKFMALGAMFGGTKTKLGRWGTSLGLRK